MKSGKSQKLESALVPPNKACFLKPLSSFLSQFQFQIISHLPKISIKTMSIIPINNQQNRISLRNQFPDFPFPLPLDWDDFPFPSPLSRFFPDFGSTNTHTRLDWKETPNSYILTASLPSSFDVLIQLLDDRMLQISTESGSFMTRFKIPPSGNLQELNAFMDYGVLTVFIPKVEGSRPDLRVIEITGGDGDGNSE